MLYLAREMAPEVFLVGAWDSDGVYEEVVRAGDPAVAARKVDAGVEGSKKPEASYADLAPEWAVIEAVLRKGSASFVGYVARPIEDLVLVKEGEEVARGLEALRQALDLGLYVDVGVPGDFLSISVAGDGEDEGYELGFREAL